MGGGMLALLLLLAVYAEKVQSSAQVEFSQSYFVVGEEEGWVEVGLTASGPTATSYTVLVTTHSGSAHSGEDFTEGDHSVIFNPGETTAKIYITIINDANTLEGDESFTLALKDTSSSRHLGVSVDATSTATVTILDNDIVGVEFERQEYKIDVNSNEEFVLQLTTTEKPHDHFLVRVNLNKGAATGVSALRNMDSYFAFFKAGETTSKLHIPVNELLAGTTSLVVFASISIPDVSYSLGVRAGMWDKAIIIITGELPYDPMWDILEDDGEDLLSRRVARQAGSGSGVDLGVCDEPAPAHPVSQAVIAANSVRMVLATSMANFNADQRCMLQIEVADAATMGCTTGQFICASDAAARRRRQAAVTVLPGHVIITSVDGSGSETTVTLYIGLPLSATPVDPNNPIILGSVATSVVQTAEAAIEAALGVQVVDNSIVRAPDSTDILGILTTALLLAIIIPVVVGVVCLAGLAGLLLAIIVVCVVKKKKTAVAPVVESMPALGIHKTKPYTESKEMLMTDLEQPYPYA